MSEFACANALPGRTPNLLGAHRYTTCGGIVRPAGSSLRPTCQSMFGSRSTQRQRTEGINGNKKS